MTIDTSREAVERLLDGVTGDLRQGVLLDTPETRRWSQDEREKANASEKCNVFSGFRADDAGRSRCHVAWFHRPEDAAFFVAAPELIIALLAERDAAGAERDRAMHACEQIASSLDAALAEVARLSTSPDDAEVRAWALALDETARGHDDEYEDTGYAISKRLADEAREVSGFLTRLSQALAAETAKRKAMKAALRGIDAMLYSHGHQISGTPRSVIRATLAKHGSKT